MSLKLTNTSEALVSPGFFQVELESLKQTFHHHAGITHNFDSEIFQEKERENFVVSSCARLRDPPFYMI